jgi:hypothetical protein
MVFILQPLLSLKLSAYSSQCFRHARWVGHSPVMREVEMERSAVEVHELNGMGLMETGRCTEFWIIL